MMNNGKLTDERLDDRALVRSLAKGLTVLGLFDSEHQEWTLDGITEKTGFPRMTVPRRRAHWRRPTT